METLCNMSKYFCNEGSHLFSGIAVTPRPDCMQQSMWQDDRIGVAQSLSTILLKVYSAAGPSIEGQALVSLM